ncbi:ferritin-like domain-containing protein [Deinococcus hohokamensis]|uniref:Ferritin-like domain-containing protein n=1 Tax=Deinococcus hohokamensis TaxID=309883 RepID=A0ABV9IC93_9DEIO
MAKMNVKLQDLQDLYVEQLRDLYSAENQIDRALPLMAEAATDPDLKQSFLDHQVQTQEQIGRLEGIFQTLGQDPGGHTCKAMQGIVAEGEDMIQERAASAVKDAGLIASAQRIEHYEITGYGTVATYADVLGLDEQASILRTTLEEERQTDERLTLAAQQINVEAAES